MGAVPLLTRDGEVSLARKMERGKLRMQKSISRSPLIQMLIVDMGEQIKKDAEDLDSIVDLGNADVEEGSTQDLKRRAEVKQQFVENVALFKKQQQLLEKAGTIALANKKLRRKAL